MQYFEQDFLLFFIDLAANNNRDWFQENKKRYEKSVKEPFKKFVDSLISEVKKTDHNISIEAKDAIFRINRDIRFSKDKSPYKLHMGAVISPQGRKDKSYPGIYIEITPERLGVFGGAWSPDKKQLQNIREAISNNPEYFERIISAQGFRDYFPGGILGEKNVRLPKDLSEAALKQELIYNKQFYYQAELDPELIFSENLIEKIMNHYHAAKQVNDFLIKAITK